MPALWFVNIQRRADLLRVLIKFFEKPARLPMKIPVNQSAAAHATRKWRDIAAKYFYRVVCAIDSQRG